jgi:hypothetical protein
LLLVVEVLTVRVVKMADMAGRLVIMVMAISVAEAPHRLLAEWEGMMELIADLRVCRVSEVMATVCMAAAVEVGISEEALECVLVVAVRVM